MKVKAPMSPLRDEVERQRVLVSSPLAIEIVSILAEDGWGAEALTQAMLNDRAERFALLSSRAT